MHAQTLPAPGDLSGEWRFRRRMADLRTGRSGCAEGILTVDAERRVWTEAGQLSWDGRRTPVSRAMAFTRVEDEWWMTFTDGRLFHPWRLGQVVEHPCRADIYRGLLVLDRSVARLRIAWDVTGPAKHQRIITRYRRIET